MNFDVDAHTILLVNHGSHAYGTNTATSDHDVKGVCVEPLNHHFGFLHNFEQYERMGNSDGGNLHKLKSLHGKDADIVIYSLKKFAKLAADCNPNIIEVLHVDDSDVLFANRFGQALRDARNAFLSKKAKFTFSGYAHAQLKRIRTHRAWLLDPPKEPPSRQEFGLSEEQKVSKSELGAFESYTGGANNEQLSIDPITNKLKVESVIPLNVMQLFNKEKQYQQALLHWQQYNHWLKTRNPARAELEKKYGYDTKHGMHLLRLMRMCREILVEGRVYVKRPDFEDLLSIRNGMWDYDRLIEEAERIEAECDELYKTSSLQKEPDRKMLDDLIVDITEEYLKGRAR